MKTHKNNHSDERANLICNHLSRLLSRKVYQGSISDFVGIIRRKDYHRGFAFTKQFSQWILKAALDDDDRANFYGERLSVDLPLFRLNRRDAAALQSFIHEFNKLVDRKGVDKYFYLSALMGLHTAFVPMGRPSKAELEVIRNHIHSTKTIIPNEIIEEFKQTCKHFMFYLAGFGNFRLERKPIAEFPSLSTKKAFVPSLKQNKGRNIPIHYNFEFILKDKRVLELFNSNPNIFINYAFGRDVNEYVLEPWIQEQIIDYPYSGSISLLPSPKNKFRPIAVPSLIFLSLNYPLAQFLKQAGSTLPSHGMFDHDEAARRVSKQIDGKKNIYSIDYSSFTDHFPFDLQKVLLTQLENWGFITSFDVKVQEMICSMPYKFDGGTITYTNGTPQGTFASFPLASICHMLIGHMAYKRLYGSYRFSKQIPMIVIGDDAVIFDDYLYHQVKDIMGKLNVPIHDDKTLINPRFAEFCSKFISKDKPYLMKKLKELNTRSSYLKAYVYYDGNIKIPKEFKNILRYNPPYGVNTDKEDYASDHFNLIALLSTNKDEIAYLHGKEFQIYIERKQTFYKCFQKLDWTNDPKGLLKYFNPLIKIGIYQRKYIYNDISDEFYKSAIKSIRKQLKSGSYEYNPHATAEAIQSSTRRSLNTQSLADPEVFTTGQTTILPKVGLEPQFKSGFPESHLEMDSADDELDFD